MDDGLRGVFLRSCSGSFGIVPLLLKHSSLEVVQGPVELTARINLIQRSRIDELRGRAGIVEAAEQTGTGHSVKKSLHDVHRHWLLISQPHNDSIASPLDAHWFLPVSVPGQIGLLCSSSDTRFRRTSFTAVTRIAVMDLSLPIQTLISIFSGVA